ncbi:glycoside hydrolase family 97 protein [uncultured Proteiniphilum sp.]|uniref:glycoside hydrolase family 97 protein n=1 Tax=uncultured Proteiniphilum sp. TaxID=497637 RepID=UPI002624DA01|nr:glycoside hydrolase family 97 protein [uncultured Proteiniphilum sp.]
MKKILIIVVLFCCMSGYSHAQKQFSVSSPDNKLKVNITVDQAISYTLTHENDLLIDTSPISMTLASGEVWGEKARVQNSKTNKKSGTISSPFSKSATIKEEYNELTIHFRGDWGLTFRMYDDGMAYRFVSRKKIPFQVKSEEVAFRFPSDFNAFIPYVREDAKDPFQSSFENTYTHTPVSGIDSEKLMFLPILVEANNGKKVCITEVDLESYPGMYLRKSTDTVAGLQGVFAGYPSKTEQGGHNKLQQRVQEREGYIANIKGSREFPWRVALVSTDDKQLAVSDMTYKLASPSRVDDTSWIKTGKVAWDWWNTWNVYGVDFKAGINNETYKYYIDFASEHGIEYVILDEGWAVNLEADLLKVVPEIDLQELVDYAKQRNVGIILWAGYWAFDRDMENVCRHYSEMGVKGFKVDFMDRDDQQMVDFIYRASETAARYKLILDFHGMYKPAGLQRTYPNVLNFEGVFGLEQLKWSPESVDMVTYDVTVPFIRMAAGPMDYTQGAMRNASKGNYRPINSEPMSQGTRCRQLALYVVFESPVNMLCDSPSNYMKESESLEFISQIPTVWDESVALNGEVAKYVTVARRKANDWYIGGITNWESRDMEIDLSFLPEGYYRVTLFRDGANAHRKGIDYVWETRRIHSGETLSVHLAPGGGFAIKLEKVE